MPLEKVISRYSMRTKLLGLVAAATLLTGGVAIGKQFGGSATPGSTTPVTSPTTDTSGEGDSGGGGLEAKIETACGFPPGGLKYAGDYTSNDGRVVQNFTPHSSNQMIHYHPDTNSVDCPSIGPVLLP